MESEADKSFSQSTLQQTSMKHLRSNDAAIAQREREINDIAKGIIELADIFKDLQAMVIDQGTMLDRIDYNVERMAVDVKGAEKELVVVRCCYPISPFVNVNCYYPTPCPNVLRTGYRLPEKVHEAQNHFSAVAHRRRHDHPSSRQAQASQTSRSGNNHESTSRAH